MTVLRPATPLDAGAVGGILSEFVNTTDWMPRIHTQAEDLSHAGDLIERGWVTVAITHGSISAFAACENGRLQALYVLKKCRNNGIGATLLQALQARNAELSLWTFQHNTAAQRFYLRHGFQEILRTDGARNDEKLPDIQYVWRKAEV